MTLSLYGLGVSRGVAIGKVYVLQRDQLEISEYRIEDHAIDAEVARFEAALSEARDQLHAIRSQIPAITPVDINSFIDTHLLMLRDDALVQVPIDLIRSRRCNAEWALKLQRDSLAYIFDQMDDPYLRTRKDDVDYVVHRVLSILLNRAEQPHEAWDQRLIGSIVVASDLSPADTVLMQHRGIAALVTEYGGTTSHTAIMARGLGIPAVVGVHNLRRYLRDDETVIVDGQDGLVMAAPDQAGIAFYRAKQEGERRHAASLTALRDAPAVSRDGQAVELQANIELPEDLAHVAKVAAKGIGLYRTEFLFMNRADLPGEEEQYRTYVGVLEALNGAPVTIRTLDIGADKPLHSHGHRWVMDGGSALGLRAIRLCLREPALFRPQLRAILRASAHGPLRMMIPLLSNVREVLQVMALLQEVKGELRKQQLAFNEKMPLGGMVEVPAAALSADVLARHLDFLSIGTNDLVQYTVAADRIDDQVNYLYDPLNPGVLRLIQMTIAAGQHASIPVSMCGEMAGDVRYTRLLLGMGLRSFSMQPQLLLEVKRWVTDSDTSLLQQKVMGVLHDGDPDAIERLVEDINAG